MSASTTPVAVIRTHALGKVYSPGSEAEVVALRDVDLHISRGDFVAIMGPSGSGKSTLMNLIGCLDTPSSGKYECDGVDVSTLDAEELAVLRRDKIGFVFQGFNLLPRMSALENVAMPLGYAQVPPAERLRLGQEALVAVGLADRAGHRPSELSGGQQQRVAIARALMQDPEVLLADEPVASLDPESSSHVMALIREIAAERDLTVVCSLHQVDLALGWGDRIIGLRAGKVVLDTPTDGLSHEQVMEIYGRVATSTRELMAIEQELADVRDAMLSEELQKDADHELERERDEDTR